MRFPAPPMGPPGMPRMGPGPATESATAQPRTPGFKLLLAILIGIALAIPLFSVWWLVYDRQSQRDEASRSITASE